MENTGYYGIQCAGIQNIFLLFSISSFSHSATTTLCRTMLSNAVFHNMHMLLLWESPPPPVHWAVRDDMVATLDEGSLLVSLFALTCSLNSRAYTSFFIISNKSLTTQTYFSVLLAICKRTSLGNFDIMTGMRRLPY